MSGLIASLTMYDWPEQRADLDNYWHKLADKFRAAGIDAPLSLLRGDAQEVYWLDENLLLGQTCGYPLSTSLKGRVRYVATPVYDAIGCSGPNYSSAIVVHKDSLIDENNLSGCRFAFNSHCSLSGYRVVKATMGSPESLFGSLLETGDHRNSARAVAEGNADVAAIDAVCWHMLQKFESKTAEKLRVLSWTEMRPSLPLITSLSTPEKTVDQMQKILVETRPEKSLAISGYEVLEVSEYNALASL